ncbi:hypothetical protein GC163_11180 [bacterium]|nr:hypothetical protein [bacterium]
MVESLQTTGRVAPSSAIADDPVHQTVTWKLLELQQRLAYLTNEDLLRLAQKLETPLHQLEEVVSFFPHFRRERPPVCEVHVCRDLACHRAGAARLIAELQQAFPDQPAGKVPQNIVVRPVSCLGRCDRAPAAFIEFPQQRESDLPPGQSTNASAGNGHAELYGMHQRSAEELIRVLTQCLAEEKRPDELAKTDDDASFLPPTFSAWDIDPYQLPKKGSGAAALPVHYAVIRRLQLHNQEFAGDFDAAKSKLGLFDKLKQANLRGMGGAGAPAERKWRDMADVDAPANTPRYIVCNADESEPLTFKDREILLRTPHLVVEGMILAGLHCGAERGYIYIRHEYHEQAEAVREAIRIAEQNNYCGYNVAGLGRNFYLSVFVSPGGYICGEQSALIEAMEGHRAQPRSKPPGLESNGLFDNPTLLSNVETFAWVPAIALGYSAPRQKAKPPAASSAAAMVTSATASLIPPAIDPNWYAEQGYRPNYQGPPAIRLCTGVDAVATSDDPQAVFETASGTAYKGRRLFSICGDVGNPGVYEMPIGAPLRDLIQLAGGAIGGESQIRALATSGPSGGFLPARITDPNLVACFRFVLTDQAGRCKKGVDRSEQALRKLLADAEPLRQEQAAWIALGESGSPTEVQERNARLNALGRDIARAQSDLADTIARNRRLEHFCNQLMPDGADSQVIDLLGLPLDIDAFRTTCNEFLELGPSIDPDAPAWKRAKAVHLPAGALLGAGMAVFAGEVDMIDLARNATEFFSRETCGKCVPCRLGSGRFVQLLKELTPDALTSEHLQLISDLDEALRETSICALGTSVPAPLMSLLKYFWDLSKVT